MAKLRMTYKNLKALRKSKEYQALLVDLVANNIVPKSTAEGLLGYTIPANLIGGEESNSEEEETPAVTPGKITLVYFDRKADEWLTAEYTLTGEDTEETVLAAAQTALNLESLNMTKFVELNPEYVEGTTDIGGKYIVLDPQPLTFTAIKAGDIVKVYYDELGK